MLLCEYSNILGEPKKGFHSIRIFDFSLLDIIATFILAYLIYRYTKVNYIILLIILILLGIFLHWLFCVDTKLSQLLNW